MAVLLEKPKPLKEYMALLADVGLYQKVDAVSRDVLFILFGNDQRFTFIDKQKFIYELDSWISGIYDDDSSGKPVIVHRADGILDGAVRLDASLVEYNPEIFRPHSNKRYAGWIVYLHDGKPQFLTAEGKWKSVNAICQTPSYTNSPSNVYYHIMYFANKSEFLPSVYPYIVRHESTHYVMETIHADFPHIPKYGVELVPGVDLYHMHEFIADFVPYVITPGDGTPLDRFKASLFTRFNPEISTIYQTVLDYVGDTFCGDNGGQQ